MGDKNEAVELPKTVLIGGMEYQIVQETPVLNARGLMGESDCFAQTITVKDNPAAAKRLQTLVHEILHCLIHEVGLPEKYQEHKLIDPLSNGLFRLLRENDFSFIRESKNASSSQTKENPGNPIANSR